MKSYGKKAIGYIKGMNGHKAATAAVAALESMYPGSGAILSGAIVPAGNMINSALGYIERNLEENISRSRYPGGVRKTTRGRLAY